MKCLIRVAVFFFMIGVLQSGFAQDIFIHPSVSQDGVSRNVLRAIFGMRLRKWPSGLPIEVFVLPDHAREHIEFSKSILHMFPYQLRRAWDRQVFSGTGQAPHVVVSLDEMKKKIINTPGAIGYLNIEQIQKEKIEGRLKELHVR